MWNSSSMVPMQHPGAQRNPQMPSVIGAALPSMLSSGALGGILAAAGHAANKRFPALNPASARSGLGLGHGLMALGATIGAAGALGGIAAGVSQAQLNASYKSMLQRYPELAREEPTRVHELFVSVSRAAPDVAKDYVVMGSLIKRMLNYDGVDHATFMELVRTQESLTKTRATQMSPLISASDVGVRFISPLV